MSPKRLRVEGADVLQLVVDYVKQETIGPLSQVGRFLIFGIIGSLAIAIGLVLLLLALLRLLQGETTAFAGNLSWVPYLIVAVVAMVLIGLAIWRISAGPAARRRPEPPEGGK
jgi:hypothetical protein